MRDSFPLDVETNPYHWKEGKKDEKKRLRMSDRLKPCKLMEKKGNQSNRLRDGFGVKVRASSGCSKGL